MVDGKPKFTYHQQSRECTEAQLKALIGDSESMVNLEHVSDPNLKKLDSFNENTRAGRLAWLGHWLYEPKVAGSSPARPTTKTVFHLFLTILLVAGKRV
jgi:hypothetical protein